ncbi:hypothetical protein R0Q57_08330 [Lactobacillus acidophilus]
MFKKYFGEDAVSEIQGSWFFFQSPNTQVDKNLYPAKSYVEDLLNKIKDHKLDKKYFPKSKVDGHPLIPWVRGPEFLEDNATTMNIKNSMISLVNIRTNVFCLSKWV